MKVNEIINEALRGKWTLEKIRELKPKQLSTLQKNAKDARDEDVLRMINDVNKERFEIEKRAAQHKNSLDKALARQERRDKLGAVKAATKKEIEELSRKIEDVIGSTFPDGDPVDILAPWIKRTFQCEDWEISALLDKAAELIPGRHPGGKYKSFNEYLAQTWDQYAEHTDLDLPKNPWR